MPNSTTAAEDVRIVVSLAKDVTTNTLKGELESILKNIDDGLPGIAVKISPESLQAIRDQIREVLGDIKSHTIDIPVTTSGAKDVSRDVAQITRTAETATSAMRNLGSGTGELVRQTRVYVDEAQQAASVTDTYKNSVDGITTTVRRVRDEEGKLEETIRTVTQTRKNSAQSANEAASAELKFQGALAKVSSARRQLDGDMSKSANVLRKELSEYESGIRSLYESYGSDKNLAAFNSGISEISSNISNAKIRIDELVSSGKALSSITDAIKKGEDALNRWSAAKYSANDSSRAEYANLEKSVEGLRAFRDGLPENGTFEEITENAGKARTLVSSFNTTFEKTGTTLKQNGDAAKSFGDRLSGLAKKFTSWLTVSTVVMTAVRAVRQMAQAATEIDTAMTQMQIVTKATNAEMSRFADGAAEAAKRVGSSISDIMDSATTYARLGFNMEQSTQLAEFTGMLQNIGAIDVGDAQDAITSILKAFKDIDPSQIELVMDKLVEVGNNFPISVSQIAEGMTNASSTLAAAGNTFEQSVALLTAANTTIQNASKSSTGLRTITARLRNTKADLDELGETMTTAEYEDLIQLLTKNNVSLIDSKTGEYRATYDVIADIAKQWENMTNMEQAALATAASGTRQQAVFFSLIENFQEASGAMDAMANSAGALEQAYATQSESIQFHLNQLHATFQELSADVMDSGVANFFIDLGKNILGAADSAVWLLNQVGGLKTLLVAIGGFELTKHATAIKDIVTGFASLIGMVKRGEKVFHGGGFLSGIEDTILAVRTAYREARNEGEGFISSISSGLGAGISSIGKLQLAVGAVTAAITIAVGIYSRWRQSIEEQRQEAISAAKESEEEAKSITDLYTAYQAAKAAYDSNTGSKSALTDATHNLLSALGYEDSQVKTLASEYENLDNAINRVTIDKLNNAVSEAKTGLNAAYDELNDAFGNGGDIGTIIQRFFGFGKGGETVPAWTEATEELNNKVSSILESAGLISEGSHGSTGGTFYLGDLDNPDQILAAYDKLIEARQKLQEGLTTDEYNSSGAVDMIERKIKEYSGVLQEVSDRSDTLYNDLARRDLANALAEGGIPQTTEEFARLKNELVDAAVAGGEFSHATKEDIAGAFDTAFNALSTAIPELSQYNALAAMATERREAMQKAFSQRFEKMQSPSAEYVEHMQQDYAALMSWYDNLPDDDKQLVYEISLSTDTAMWGLERWNEALAGQKTTFEELMNETGTDEAPSFVEGVEEYVEKMETLSDAWEKLNEGGLENAEIVELIGEFPELAKYTDDLSAGIEYLARTMTDAEFEEFANQFGRLSTEEDRRQLIAYRNTVLAVGQSIGSTKFGIDIETEIGNLDAFWSAIDESVSATGLGAESIQALAQRYKELDDYDASALFEKTAHGVHLNVQEVQKLEQEYTNLKRDSIHEQLKQLIDEYSDLTAQILLADDTVDKSELFSQREEIQENIDQISLLAAQYDGLTSAFNRWQQAQSSGDENDMYMTLSNGIEDMEKLRAEGWVGTDDFRTFVQLMTDTDMATASAEELLAVYEQGLPTIKQFFTGAEEGGQVQGLQNFIDTLLEVQEQVGETWVALDENGQYHIDFGIGGDEEVANAISQMTEFQMSAEEVQILLRALSSAGWDVNLDSIYTAIDSLVGKAMVANEELKELGKTDVTFDFNTTDLDDLTNNQIPKAQNLLRQFVQDGEVNLELEGADQAVTILTTLVHQKWELEKPAIMSVDTSSLEGVDDDLANAIEMMQQLGALYEQLQVTNLTPGADPTETLQEIQEVSQQLSELPDETFTKLGLDKEGFEASLKEITEKEVDINGKLVISEEDVANVVNQLAEIDPESVLIKTNSDAAMKELAAIDSFAIGDKNVKVTLKDYATKELTRINNIKLNPKTLTITTVEKTVSTKTSSSSSSKSTTNPRAKAVTVAPANGMAYANGTAHLTGGSRSNAHDLGGELGRELVVRDGRYFTIGDDSAEFFKFKKGDIIFNADQTEQLFKYGKITNGDTRGYSYAEGNAYSDATSQFHVGGMYGDGFFSTAPYDWDTSSSGSDGSDEEDESQVIDWIEIAIDRIERAINRLATIAQSAYRGLAERLGATNDEMTTIAQEISVQQAGYARYMQQANSVGLSPDLAQRVQSGAIDINEYDSDTADLIREYQEWYEKALDCADAIQQLNENIAELYKNKFDDIATDYENQLSLLEHLTTTFDNGLNDIETRGYFASTDFYKAMQEVERQNITTMESELDSLTRALSEAVNSGYIKEGSEAWYDMQQQINATKEAIQESNTAIVEFANSIREAEWERFDYLLDRISQVADEADFLIDLMDSADLYTDNGQLTDTGTAVMGMHGQNYNVYMNEADKYAEEIKRLNKELADDPNNLLLLERRQELVEAQRDSILAAESEKEAIVDMVREGIELELDALQKLIDTYEDSLDSAKDMYEYQKKVKEQTSEVASIQKQLLAYANDDSEENRAVKQRLEVSLQEAQENLNETQYDKYISDQKALLDNLYTNYELILNQRLDNIDALIADMVAHINENAAGINNTILQAASEVGYTISTELGNIWAMAAEKMLGNDALSRMEGVITTYAADFQNRDTSTKLVLDGIKTDVEGMIRSSNALAEQLIAAATKTTPVDTSIKPPVSTSTTPQSATQSMPSTNPWGIGNGNWGGGSSGSSRALTDKDYYGVALAIWNGTYGWGNGDDRVSRLRAKGFDPSRMQDVVNQLLNDVYNNSWYGKYFGITDLAPYAYNRYASGGFINYTGLAQVDGSPSKPEMVLNPQDTENFVDLRDAMRMIADGTSPLSELFGKHGSAGEILDNLRGVETPETDGDTRIGDVTYQITIPIDHVEDYDDFMNQLRKDGKFEKFIRSMTVDRLAGSSRLAKNRYEW